MESLQQSLVFKENQGPPANWRTLCTKVKTKPRFYNHLLVFYIKIPHQNSVIAAIVTCWCRIEKKLLNLQILHSVTPNMKSFLTLIYSEAFSVSKSRNLAKSWQSNILAYLFFPFFSFHLFIFYFQYSLWESASKLLYHAGKQDSDKMESFRIDGS